MAAPRSLALEQTLEQSGYAFKKNLGEGSYGRVDLCLNPKGEKVAIKTMKIDFYNIDDTKRLIREIYLLRQFNHPNICPLLDIVVPPPGKDFDQISIVLEYRETDLQKIIHSRQQLTAGHPAYFITQILNAVSYLNKVNVMHRDIKPGNILVNSDCSIQVCDFNLSRQTQSPLDAKAESEIESIIVDPDKPGKISDFTRYVVTRWYRAPEIILTRYYPSRGVDEYGPSSDIWSIGIVLLGLLMKVGKLDTHFFQGSTTKEQLDLIFELMGVDKDFTCIKNKAAREFLMKESKFKLGHTGSLERRLASLKENITKINTQYTEFNKKRKIGEAPLELIDMNEINLGIDLLKKMLQIDPDKRISIQDALNHPYLAMYKEQVLKSKFSSQLRNEKGQLNIAGASAVWLSQLERREYITEKMLREYFWKMIKSFKTEEVIKYKVTAPEAEAVVPETDFELPKTCFWHRPRYFNETKSTCPVFQETKLKF